MITLPAITRLAYWIRKNAALSRVALALLPDPVITKRLGEIGLFGYRLRTNRQFWLRDPSVEEYVPWAMLRGFVQAESVVFDCGANVGLYCRYLASVLGCRNIYAFEPDPRNRELLSTNLRLGQLEDAVIVLPCALADVDGDSEFQVDDVQSTSGTLNRASHGQASEGRRNVSLPPLVRLVECRTIDSLLRSGQVPAPNVLKIDVEGAEALLLRGANELLREQGPDLVIEIHGAVVAREVLQHLLGLQYHIVGQVEKHVDPSGVALLHAEAVTLVNGQYDLRFLAASKSRDRVDRILKTLRV